MTVSGKWYGKALSTAFGGVTEAETALPIDYLTDTIKVSLHTSTYAVSQDTHRTWADTTNEVPDTGNYVARGATLGSKTLTYDTGTNIIMFDAGNTVWATSTISNARYAVVYKDSGVDATSPLLGYVDFGADVSSSGGSFTITWDTAGILIITAA